MEPIWFMLIGVLLVLMALLRSIVDQLPLSTAVIYLAIGYLLGPVGADWLRPDLVHSPALALLLEIAMLVSLFTVGLKLDLAVNDPAWWLPVRLAVPTMLITIGLLTVAGHYLLDFSWPLSFLMGTILAPTDPVLASDIQLRHNEDRDRFRFAVTAEGGLNDGTATPFFFLALGVLGLHNLGDHGFSWLSIDLVWGVCAGLLMGWGCGLGVGRLVLWLRRRRHEDPAALEEFITLGLIALSYGAAQGVGALGFLAVLAAGIGMRRVTAIFHDDDAAEAAGKAQASKRMLASVQGYNERFERILEVAAVLLLGGLLSVWRISWPGVGFALLLFFVLRPMAVVSGLAGTKSSWRQQIFIAWFGIRGVGSLYYLSAAVLAGLAVGARDRLIPVVLSVIATSIVLHGISATPLMETYKRRRPRAAAAGTAVRRRKSSRQS